MAGNKSKFRVTKVTKFDDIIEASGKNTDGTMMEVPTSDLCLTSDKGIVQFEYVEGDEKEEQRKLKVSPGIYTMTMTAMGMRLDETELRTDDLLKEVANTKVIIGQAEKFFSKLHVYARRKRKTVKRAVLYYSLPGNGKSAAIRYSINELIKADKGTVALIWPTSELKSEHVGRFFSFLAEYGKDVTRVILVMEEIGGSEDDGVHARREVSAGMLNFLDGINVTFKKPTFIVATTNYPQNLLKELADRPGRFDRLIELPPPGAEEKIKLLEHFEDRKLSDEEKEALRSEKARDLSIAHLQEIGLRAELEDMSFAEVIRQMVEHKKTVTSAFEKVKEMGLGSRI